jgi:hypothetical protein
MLHIHNGDSSAETAKLSALPGEHFAFREALMEGQAPGEIAGDEWRSVRARHLSESYGVDLEQCERELVAQENKLAASGEHEEIVFWFEHDLFCQVNLLYLLDWFSLREPHHTRLSLVCVDHFPGVADFRGLGQLTTPQLVSLFPSRTEIKRPQLELASTAWQAYCSPNPIAIEDLLATDTSALPFLAAALRLHLRRFPSVKNGLGEIENTGLKLIKSGSSTFTDLFPRFGDAKPTYGLGDAQFWLALRRMSNARQPLVTNSGFNGNATGSALTPTVLQNVSFKITAIGESVLRGEADFVSLNGIDIWLGGVHLDGVETLWRWDEPSGRMVSK